MHWQQRRVSAKFDRKIAVGDGIHRVAANAGSAAPVNEPQKPGYQLPLDRQLVARLLGFVDRSGRPRISRNSMDAVADRDFAVEFCAHASLLPVHLSRLADDLVVWASTE